MNISLQFEPLDCSFCDWPSDTYAVQPTKLILPSHDKTTLSTTGAKKQQKQSLRCLHAIDELLQTERDYTNHLAYLVEVCFGQILQRQKWILDKHKVTIIRNANELLQFHKLLLLALEDAYLEQDIITKCGHIATVFLDMGSSFTLYDTYCDKHDAAIALCNEYRSKPEWIIFTRDCATPTTYPSEQVTRPLHFEDYLIKPVQRVCRYQLLLKEILHYTPRGTSEYRRLDCALGMMQAVVAGIDRRKYDRDTTERTRLFIDRLDSSSDGRLDKNSLHLLGNLVMAGAIDVTYSSLGQTTVSSSRSKYLGCFVFPTYLIMVRPKKVTSYTPKHWFPLRLVELEDLQDIKDQRENAFVVRCKKHCFAFTATCQREKRLWLTKLSQAIATAKSQPRSADNFLVSSLYGIGKPTKIRTSRSVTNLLDFGHCSTTSSILSSSKLPPIPQHHNNINNNNSSNNNNNNNNNYNIHYSPAPTALFKRHSADFSPRTKKREQLKARIHSEVYVGKLELSDPSKLQHRPGSMDVMSTSSSQLSLNMIGKIKSNHQHALRIGSDHKLRDVCTQDYLASRSWSTL
ncbi:Dbl homology domain-containing protein, partial [Halteromyces radiatus]|uniref:Dbl homology domain-containing protein n=1 Tax=Halteromyces radiatus TaxID=101107 RepID=UPI00221F4B98